MRTVCVIVRDPFFAGVFDATNDTISAESILYGGQCVWEVREGVSIVPQSGELTKDRSFRRLHFACYLHACPFCDPSSIIVNKAHHSGLLGSNNKSDKNNRHEQQIAAIPCSLATISF